MLDKLPIKVVRLQKATGAKNSKMAHFKGLFFITLCELISCLNKYKKLQYSTLGKPGDFQIFHYYCSIRLEALFGCNSLLLSLFIEKDMQGR